MIESMDIQKFRKPKKDARRLLSLMVEFPFTWQEHDYRLVLGMNEARVNRALMELKDLGLSTSLGVPVAWLRELHRDASRMNDIVSKWTRKL